MNCMVTERALREIYLMAFMLTIKIGNPGAIMAAYNKINGLHITEDKRILHDILRKEWGFRGLVMSDWLVNYQFLISSLDPSKVVLRKIFGR
jgi:beta-glucosidase